MTLMIWKLNRKMESCSNIFWTIKSYYRAFAIWLDNIIKLVLLKVFWYLFHYWNFYFGGIAILPEMEFCSCKKANCFRVSLTPEESQNLTARWRIKIKAVPISHTTNVESSQMLVIVIVIVVVRITFIYSTKVEQCI